MKDQFLIRWNSFSEKERFILMALAIAMLCLLLYAFAWLPMQQGRERLSRIIPDKQAKLLLMQSQAADIERLREQYKSLRSMPDTLKAAIEVSAKYHGLTPSYPPTEKSNAANQLSITLTQIRFDAWIKWVESLQTQNHIRVQSCHITPSGVAGQVTVEAILIASDSQSI